MAVNRTNGGNDAPFAIPNIKNTSELFTRSNMININNIENLTQLGYDTSELFSSKFGIKSRDMFLVKIVLNIVR